MVDWLVVVSVDVYVGFDQRYQASKTEQPNAFAPATQRQNRRLTKRDISSVTRGGLMALTRAFDC